MNSVVPIKPPYWNIIVEVFLDQKNNPHGRYFRIPTDPVGVDFDLRSRRQWNVFFFGTKQRNRRKGKVLYVTHQEFQWIASHEIHKKSMAKYGKAVADPEFIELKCLNDLFPLIGYDYKAKKWLL